MTFNLKHYLKEAFVKGTSINDYNVKSAALIGSVGHPLFAALHIYLFMMPWDSIGLKAIGAVICLLLLTRDKWPQKLKPLFSYYWHFMLIYNLPFLITLTALNNHFIKTWFLWEVIMIFILIMYVSHWLIFFIDLLIGVVLALLCHSIIMGGAIFEPVTFSYDSHLDFLLYLSTFIFAIISGLIFSYSNAKGIASEERAKIFKSLAGSIAHELRNPLNTINLIGTQINELAPEFDKHNGNGYNVSYSEQSHAIPSVTIVPTAKSQLLNLTSHITDAISNANNIINIILGDLSEKQIDPDDLEYLKPNQILPDILEKFGYRNDAEKAKVKLLLSKHEEDDFLLKAVPDRLTYIVFNLLKNALYYLNEYPDSIVTVGNETREVNGTEYSVIYVNDTGPGIPPHVISKLFGDFYTSGKKEGTGLGLSFCKRNMEMFGGDIICESEFGKWTRFSLLFPKLDEEEIKKVERESKKKKILLVDDQKVNLITTKSKIERILFNVSCDVVSNAKDAVRMARQNKYQLILMDIEMPEINGIETTKRIRSYDKETPIIALTSLNKRSFLAEANNNVQKDFSYYLSKTATDNILCRGLTKWIFGMEDTLPYLGTEEEILETLRGKKVILADDQQLNRMITRNSFAKSGLIVTEAQDGKELLEIYKNSLNENGVSSFDIIVTDVNMPPHDGDDAAKEIRQIEGINNISHHDEIPIIALSGDGGKEDIHHFFDCQMTDYFIKGGSPELLLKIVANYILKKDAKIYDLAVNDIEEDVSLEKGCLADVKIFDRKNTNFFEKEDQKELLELFLKDSSDVMLKIKESAKENDSKKILLHIHSIKGASANIGASKLAYYIRALEPTLKSDNHPKNWLQNLEKIYSELEDEIRKILAQ